MSLRPFRLVAPIALAMVLSACGFHLRNALTLPADLGPVKVVSVDRYSPLAASLALSLDRAGAVPATADTTDAAVLDLLAESWGDTPAAVDALGRTQELTLRYAVIFELRKGNGDVLVPRQTIELARDYVSNPVNSIGTEGEREILQRELRREMAASVLRRIDVVARQGGTTLMPAAVAPDAITPSDVTPAADTDGSTAPAPR